MTHFRLLFLVLLRDQRRQLEEKIQVIEEKKRQLELRQKRAPPQPQPPPQPPRTPQAGPALDIVTQGKDYPGPHAQLQGQPQVAPPIVGVPQLGSRVQREESESMAPPLSSNLKTSITEPEREGRQVGSPIPIGGATLGRSADARPEEELSRVRRYQDGSPIPVGGATLGRPEEELSRVRRYQEDILQRRQQGVQALEVARAELEERQQWIRQRAEEISSNRSTRVTAERPSEYTQPVLPSSGQQDNYRGYPGKGSREDNFKGYPGLQPSGQENNYKEYQDLPPSGQEGNYGEFTGLPPSGQEENYGGYTGLPPCGQEDNYRRYSGLPSSGQDDDYRRYSGLPPSDQENNYREYPGLPSSGQDNNYRGYTGLPPSGQDNNFRGYPDLPLGEHERISQSPHVTVSKESKAPPGVRNEYEFTEPSGGLDATTPSAPPIGEARFSQTSPSRPVVNDRATSHRRDFSKPVLKPSVPKHESQVPGHRPFFDAFNRDTEQESFMSSDSQKIPIKDALIPAEDLSPESARHSEDPYLRSESHEKGTQPIRKQYGYDDSIRDDHEKGLMFREMEKVTGSRMESELGRISQPFEEGRKTDQSVREDVTGRTAVPLNQPIRDRSSFEQDYTTVEPFRYGKMEGKTEDHDFPGAMEIFERIRSDRLKKLPSPQQSQSAPSPEVVMKARQRDVDFDQRQIFLKNQLEEIRKQKAEILRRQEEYQRKAEEYSRIVIPGEREFAGEFEERRDRGVPETDERPRMGGIRRSESERPPLTKHVAFLDDLPQHQLSVIQEVDTPRSSHSHSQSQRKSPTTPTYLYPNRDDYPYGSLHRTSEILFPESERSSASHDPLPSSPASSYRTQDTSWKELPLSVTSSPPGGLSEQSLSDAELSRSRSHGGQKGHGEGYEDATVDSSAVRGVSGYRSPPRTGQEHDLTRESLHSQQVPSFADDIGHGVLSYPYYQVSCLPVRPKKVIVSHNPTSIYIF